MSTEDLHSVTQKAVMFEIKLQEDRMQGEADEEPEGMDEKDEVKYH